MKKLVLGIIVISLVAVGVFYVYNRYVIQHVSEAIIQEEIPDVVPENLKRNALSLKKDLSRNSDDIVEYLHQNEVPLEEFNSLIDKVEYYEVQKFLERVKSKEFSNANEAFDFISQSFDFGDIPLENFRDDFVRNYDNEKFDQFARYFERNSDQMQMMFPLAKETLKKLLVKEYAKRDSL